MSSTLRTGAKPAFRSAASSSSSAPRSGPSFYPQPASASSPKPPPLWFTARPSLNATLASLGVSLTASRAHLFRAGLLPSVAPSAVAGREGEFAALLPHPRARRWKQPKAMATYLRNGTELKMAEYKRLTSLLGSLEGLLPYAELADQLDGHAGAKRAGRVPSLAVDPVEATKAGVEAEKGDTSSLRSQLEYLLSQFQHAGSLSASGETIVRVAGAARPLGTTDHLGRIQATGRRKEASARVWVLPVPSTTPSSGAAPVPGQVLVNALPLPGYFGLPAHRERAVLPLSLTASLGAFNVFAIVKGGGHAAQADAVAVGLARGLVEYEKAKVAGGEWEEGETGWREALKKGKHDTLRNEGSLWLLFSPELGSHLWVGRIAGLTFVAPLVPSFAAELLERDPRVVERKKTGQLKARKKFAWVKR